MTSDSSNKSNDYVELRCKSAFSFLEGASQPERLVERAQGLGYDSLALADRDGLYAVPRFHEAAREAGLRCIFGSELTLFEDGQAFHFLALVENQTGYANLSRLITR
ncbi:MAG: PHP domain-containing protein, partial [Deltaproteobacteria bacterium]|nr:PHP domain-containing protein [Deltaproteobacteria bacterium]